MVPLVAFLALQTGSVDPAKDPAYAKPVTVELAMAPLRAIVSALAKATGKSVDVTGSVVDWKATVLVKDLPAGRAMEALADTMGLVWKADGETLRLSRPEGDAAAITAFEKEELATVQKSGDVMVATSNPGTPVVTPGSYPRNRRGPGGNPDRGRASTTRFNPYLLAVENGNAQPPSRLRPAAPMGDTPFAKAATAWPTLPAKPDPTWDKPVGTVFVKSAWEGGEISLADLLTAWHAASGLPVVADAFRVPLHSTNVLPTSALAGLQGVAARDGMALKLADGVVRMRHPAFWRLRDQEIPESTWLSIERGRADLGSLAIFASRLNAAQAASFHSDEAPLSHVSTAAIREAYPALLLWNTLSGGVRDALLAGRPVGLAQTPGSRNAYAYALQEAPYWGAGDPTVVLRANPAQVGLFGQVVDKALDLRLATQNGNGVTYTLPL